MPQEVHTPLSDREMEQVKRVAERDGVTIDEAASRLFSQRLADKVKKRTGKTAARVLPMRRG